MASSEQYDSPDFSFGSFIDAKDHVNNWCVAKVLSIDSSSGIVEVNFDGWSGKNNEQFGVLSSKVAPFRRHSPPYTG